MRLLDLLEQVEGPHPAALPTQSLIPLLTVAMQFSSGSYTSDWMSGRRGRRSKVWMVPSPELANTLPNSGSLSSAGRTGCCCKINKINF